MCRYFVKTLYEKNKAYGSAFQKSGDIMAILYPNGIKPDQMNDAFNSCKNP
jgi:hypothetical protein